MVENLLGAIKTAAAPAWGALSTALATGAKNIDTAARKAASVAEEALSKVTLREDDGVYELCGLVTFTWRELVMIGGLIASVTLAVGSFFGGMPFIACGYLLMSGMLLFGAYYLWQWGELLPLNQVTAALRANGEEARDTLRTIAEEVTRVLEATGVREEAVLATWRDLVQTLNGNVEDLGAAVQSIPDQFGVVTKEMHRILALGEAALEAKAQHSRTLDTQLGERQAAIEAATARLGELVGRLGELENQLDKIRGVADSLTDSNRELDLRKKELATTIRAAREFIERLTQPAAAFVARTHYQIASRCLQGSSHSNWNLDAPLLDIYHGS